MTYTRARWIAGAAFAITAGAFSAGCDAGRKNIRELRFRTDSFVIRVAPETIPTRALEPIYWRVIVHDRETGVPIQGGEGRIFATNKDMKTVSNGFEETGELGTYRSNLMFVTAGMWAMAIQFRRDSTKELQKTQDWTQDILEADEPGMNIRTPISTRVKDSAKTPAASDSSRKRAP
ncbi:MAG: hypothetical protein ACK57A_03215 [Gemmatimonas sp.]|jgi:hypothetical protein|uniref:hypothetical protein n=1 Tax=Gemmatimonas sp. TaxID=1962908 RepID=UPI00391EE65D